MSRRFHFYLIPLFLAVLLLFSNDLYAQTSLKKAVKAQPAKTQPAKISAEPVKHTQAPAPVPSADQTAVTIPVAAGPGPVPWLEYLKKIGLALVTFILAFLLLKYLSRLVILISEKTHILKITTRRLVLIAAIIWWTLVSYLIIELILSPPLQTSIIILASMGLAISLSLQDILKNVFNGMSILLDRSFQAGDKIRVGQNYGQIRSISLRRIQLLTPDETIITIPSSEIVRQTVVHFDADASHSVVDVEIFLPPDIDMVEVKKVALRAAEVSRYIYLPKPLQIYFSNTIQQGQLILKLHIHAFVLDIGSERLFSSEVTEVIIQELINRKLLILKPPGGEAPKSV
jgi:small-conductance mechanosensitive channel